MQNIWIEYYYSNYDIEPIRTRETNQGSLEQPRY